MPAEEEGQSVRAEMNEALKLCRWLWARLGVAQKVRRFGLDVACPQTERSATAKMQRVAKAAGGRGSGDGSCDGTHRWTRRGE